MEYWDSKADEGLILFSNPCHPYKIRFQSAKSNIPSFHYISSRHSRLSLPPPGNGIFDWPGEPGFQCWNKWYRSRCDDAQGLAKQGLNAEIQQIINSSGVDRKTTCGSRSACFCLTANAAVSPWGKPFETV
jgi:hypothetical protein